MVGLESRGLAAADAPPVVSPAHLAAHSDATAGVKAGMLLAHVLFRPLQRLSIERTLFE